MNEENNIPKLEDLIGKNILVGITEVDHEGNVIRQTQHNGCFQSMDEVINIKLANLDELLTLPPDLSSFSPAAPGEYKLRSTGEVVINPDFLCTWTVNLKPTKECT